MVVADDKRQTRARPEGRWSRSRGLSRTALVGVVIASSLVFAAAEPVNAYETPGAATAWAGSATSMSSTFASGLVVTAALANPRAAGLVAIGTNDTLSANATSAMFTPAMPTATQAFTLTATQTTAFNDCDGEPNGTTPTTGVGPGVQTCANMAELTISFSEPVTNPVLHFAGFGGYLIRGSQYAEVVTAQLRYRGSAPAGAVLGPPSVGSVNLQSGTEIQAVNLKASTSCTQIVGPALAVAGCGSVPVIGTVTSLVFMVELDQQVTINDGSGLGNSVAADLVRVTVSVPQDTGDAPASYNGTTAPTHVIGDLKLGSMVDEDLAATANPTAGNPSANADADDNAGDDEEAVSIFPPLSAATVGQPYTLPIALSGASKAARVCGWIDFTRNGLFDNPAEQACQSVAVGATSTNLSWTIPAGTGAGASFVRIRTAYVAAQAESPTGLAASGEVEDYPITISPALFRLAKLTNGGVGSFSFSTTNTKASPIGLTTTAVGTVVTSPVTDVVAAATSITATETVPAGWSLTTVSCVDSRAAATGNPVGAFGNLVGNVVTVPAANVRVGSDITCTVTNEVTPKVSIAKTSVGGVGTFNFTTTNTAATPVAVTTLSSGSTVTSTAAAVTNRANPVTIAETAPAGWRLTGATCIDRNGTVSGNGTATFGALVTSTVTISSVNLKPGADIVCTFTNDLPATLRVTKQAIGGGGAFPFTVSGGATSSFSLNPNPPAAPQVTQVIAPVTAGTATKITESGTNANGFTLVDVSCVDQSGAPAGSTIGTPVYVNTSAEMGNLTVNLVPAADVNCVFTNIKNADIALIKVSRGGDTSVPFTVKDDTGATIIAPTITTSGGVGSSAFNVRFDRLVTSRAIDIAEVIPAGYVLTAVECTATTGSITVISSNLAAGTARATVTPGTKGSCRFTNDKRPTVTIVKQTTNGTGSFAFSGGTNGLGPTFTLDTTAANPAASAVFTITAPNTATSITETLPADWMITGVTCTNPAGSVVSAASWLVGGTLTIPAASLPGGAVLTCTYVNDKLLPKLDVVKRTGTLTGPDGAGNFSISYAVTVANSGLGSGSYGPLTDTPSPTSGLQVHQHLVDDVGGGSSGWGVVGDRRAIHLGPSGDHHRPGRDPHLHPHPDLPVHGRGRRTDVRRSGDRAVQRRVIADRWGNRYDEQLGVRERTGAADPRIDDHEVASRRWNHGVQLRWRGDHLHDHDQEHRQPRPQAGDGDRRNGRHRQADLPVCVIAGRRVHDMHRAAQRDAGRP